MSKKVKKNDRLSVSTQQNYDRRFRSLVQRYRQARAPGTAYLENAYGFANWLIEQRDDWASSTWRQYRASTVWAISEPTHCLMNCNAPELSTALDLLTRTVPSMGKPDVKRTSSRKAKRLLPKDHSKLANWIANGRSSNAKEALGMFDVTIITGLRPIEWRDARWHIDDDGTFTLTVRNAKDTHGRAPGKYRHLKWRSLPSTERDAIIDFIKLVEARTRGELGPFQKWYNVIRTAFRRAAEECWPAREQRPSMYTARHIAAAMFKLIYGPVEVAALMGHASDDTATNHYARPAKGKNAVRPEDVAHLVPEPAPEVMALVRKIRDHQFVINKPPILSNLP